MICPHCGAEHPETAGRFCQACGRSVTDFAGPPAREEEEEPPVVVCRFCGHPGRPPVCPSCGQRLRVPEPE